MQIKRFSTEHFFAQYEFNAPYQLCNSDCETITVAELLHLADIPLSEFGQLALGYTESQGKMQLRQAIASSYTTVTPEEIVMLATPVEGIYLTARTLLEADDEVIVLTPAYDALMNVFEHIVGANNVKKCPFILVENKWALNLALLEELITPQTKLIVLNFPHNPTGYLPSIDELNKLKTVIADKKISIFCDEIYYGLVHSGTTPIPSMIDLFDNTIILSGLSKTYGLPGLRTGWLIIKDQSVREDLMNWKFYTSICPPAPSEFLATAAWSVRDQLRSKSIHQIEQNLKLVTTFFARWPNLFEWSPPQAGSTALIKMNIPSVTKFATQMAKEAGILILPGTNLGTTDQYVRFGFGRSTFATALEKFEQYLLANKERIDER